MEITLTPRGEELLQIALLRDPGRSPSEVVEEALAERLGTRRVSAKGALTADEFQAWLDEFTAYSDRIPPMSGETFGREMIYQDRS